MSMTMAPGCGEISGRWRLTVIGDETRETSFKNDGYVSLRNLKVFLPGWYVVNRLYPGRLIIVPR